MKCVVGLRLCVSVRGPRLIENEDPNLDSGETVLSEVSRHVLRNRSEGSSGENIFDGKHPPNSR